MDGVDKHDAEALRAAVNDDGCEEGAHNILFPLMDVETGEIIQVVSAVVSNGKEAVTIDPNLASRYDVPQTYKQYRLSPHKAYWRTAMELKMEAYEAVPKYESLAVVALGLKVGRLIAVHHGVGLVAVRAVDDGVLERVAIVGLMRREVFHVRSEDGGDKAIARMALVTAAYSSE